MRRLRDLREDKDLTQGDMAKILGVTQTTYSRYENDVLEPSIGILKDLALFYNTSIDYLIGLTNEKKPYPRKNNSHTHQ